MRWKRRALTALLLIVLLFQMGFVSASASTILYPNDAEGIEIHRVQEKLKELGYLENTSYALDMAMRYALQLFCENNGLPYDDKGLSQEVRDILMGDGELVPYAEEDSFIPFGETSDRVTEIQIRLKNLGYFADASLNVACFDEITQKGVELFCQTNNVIYDGSGISKSLRSLILSEAALQYVAEEPNWADRLRTFLHGHILAGNVRIPNLLWLAAAYLAAYLVVMGFVLLLFAGGKRANPTRAGTAARGKVQAPVPESSRFVDFKIVYEGKTREERRCIAKDFSIGRGNCSLKLDKSDRQVSKRHCTMCFQNGSLYLSDVSRNGTYVNENLVSQATTELGNGDRLHIGEHLLIVHY